MIASAALRLVKAFSQLVILRKYTAPSLCDFFVTNHHAMFWLLIGLSVNKLLISGG